MRSTLDDLAKTLEELHALVASIAPVNSVLDGHKDSLVRKYVTIRRRFDYAAFIVALYASFENFVENLVAAYARLVARRFPYADLPPKLVKKHLAQTAAILERGRLGEGKYAGLRPLDVVKNLFECLSGITPYSLNDAAVVAHDLNLRSREINALFSVVGIEHICERVRRADALLDWYCRSKDLGQAPQDGVPSATIVERLEDVVERRNQVAHRGGSPDELLGPDEMFDTMAFIEALARSIFTMAVARYLETQHAAQGQNVPLTLREGPYQKGTIVVVDKPFRRLFVGQPAFVTFDSAGARWGRIQSLKIDDRDVAAVDPRDAAPAGIGIGLDFKCPQGTQEVFVLDADDDVVWSPVTTAPAA